MAEDSVRLEVANRIARVTLARGSRSNAFDEEMIASLHDKVQQCASMDDLRVVIIDAEGDKWCVGGDVVAMKETIDETGSGHAQFRTNTNHHHGVIRELRGMEAITIASLHGQVAGGGIGIALACDLVIASSETTITPAYTWIGATPDGGITWFLPRLLGHQRAMELLMFNRKLTASDAHDLGMVNKVVNRPDLETETQEWAVLLANGPAQAQSWIKHLVVRTWYASLENQMEVERRFNSYCGDTEAFKEGAAAFVEKRRPVFK